MSCCRLSNVTKDYLARFYDILDEMIRDMNCPGFTDSISYDFIAQMIPHHQAAIEMCENCLRFTTNLCVQDICQCIIEEQTESIAAMRRIQERCSQCENCQRDQCLYKRRVEQILPQMFDGMRCARVCNSVDCNFLRQMIPHHQGAVQMCRNCLQFDICPGLCPICQDIISSQCRGIARMEQLLRQLGC